LKPVELWSTCPRVIGQEARSYEVSMRSHGQPLGKQDGNRRFRMFDSPVDRAAGLGHDDPVTAARREHDAMRLARAAFHRPTRPIGHRIGTPPGGGETLPHHNGTPIRSCGSGCVRVWDFATARREGAWFRGFGLVRSRRASWSLRTIPCGWCGKYVRESESGRARRWCSDACRMKSYRAHRRTVLRTTATATDHHYQGPSTCPYFRRVFPRRDGGHH
jgi:hypothetical protein